MAYAQLWKDRMQVEDRLNEISLRKLVVVIIRIKSCLIVRHLRERYFSLAILKQNLFSFPSKSKGVVCLVISFTDAASILLSSKRNFE